MPPAYAVWLVNSSRDAPVGNRRKAGETAVHSAVPPSRASAHGAEERLTPVLLTALSIGR